MPNPTHRPPDPLADLVRDTPGLEYRDGWLRIRDDASFGLLAYVAWHLRRGRGLPDPVGDGVDTTLLEAHRALDATFMHVTRGDEDLLRAQALATAIVPALDLAEALAPGRLDEARTSFLPPGTSLHPHPREVGWPVALHYAHHDLVTLATEHAAGRSHAVLGALVRYLTRLEDLAGITLARDAFPSLVAAHVARLARPT